MYSQTYTPSTEYMQVRLEEFPDVALYVTAQGEVYLDLKPVEVNHKDPSHPTVHLLDFDISVATLMAYAYRRQPVTLHMLNVATVDYRDGNPQNLVPDNLTLLPYPQANYGSIDHPDWPMRGCMIPHLEDYVVLESGEIFYRPWNTKMAPTSVSETQRMYTLTVPATGEQAEHDITVWASLANQPIQQVVSLDEESVATALSELEALAV